MDPNRNVMIQSSEPISSIDTARIHLYVVRDSNLYEEPYLLLPTPHKARSYTLYAEWQPDYKYAVAVDSAAITGVMGHTNRKVRSELRIRNLNEYGTLIVNLLTKDTCMVVQLLNGSDRVVTQQRVSSSGVAEFYFLSPDIYYMRCFVDINGNGKWDVGDYGQGLQPERVYYFPKPMNVRAGWDVEQEWDVQGIPVMRQKPAELIKQKADKEKTPRERNKERDAEKAKRK